MPETSTASATDPYESHEEFLEEKDLLMGRYWLDPEDYREESRTDVAAAVAVSIFSILVVGAFFRTIFWVAEHIPTK